MMHLLLADSAATRARHHGGAGFTHEITSGLFAGVRARHVADDPSFG
jgi:hypothetical protein